MVAFRRYILWPVFIGMVIATAYVVHWCMGGVRPSARLTTMIRDMKNLVTACEIYNQENGRYPNADEGFSVVNIRNATLLDMWGRAFVYVPDLKIEDVDDEVGVYSVGPDGISRSGGHDADDCNSWSGPQRYLYEQIEAANEQYESKMFLWPSLLFFATVMTGFLLASTKPDVDGAARPYSKRLNLVLFLALIALLSGVVVTTIRTLSRVGPYTHDLGGVRGTMKMWEWAYEMFQRDMGRYPTVEEGLGILCRKIPSPGTRDGYKPPYVDLAENGSDDRERVLNDMWGNPYVYVLNVGLEGDEKKAGIYSCGPDGASFTNGNDPDDINSWSEPDNILDEILREQDLRYFDQMRQLRALFLGSMLVVIILFVENRLRR